MNLNDGNCTIFLSTQGKNKDEVPKTLVKFLEFVKADLEESTKDFEDEFVGKLQDAVRRIKTSREMEERYMLLEEMIRDERAEAKAEERDAMKKLILILTKEKRYEDLERIAEDDAFREKLYAEYHIE